MERFDELLELLVDVLLLSRLATGAASSNVGNRSVIVGDALLSVLGSCCGVGATDASVGEGGERGGEGAEYAGGG